MGVGVESKTGRDATSNPLPPPHTQKTGLKFTTERRGKFVKKKLDLLREALYKRGGIHVKGCENELTTQSA